MPYEQGAKSVKTGEVQTFEKKEDFDLHMKLHGTGVTAKFYAVKVEADGKAVEPKAGTTGKTVVKQIDAPNP